jgi:hypothetical protein
MVQGSGIVLGALIVEELAVRLLQGRRERL